MELENIKRATFREILKIYTEENGEKQDDWEIRNLERANEKFGSWIVGNLNSKDVGEIVMPHYRFGGAEIVPEGGDFLHDAYQRFSSRREYFERENSQFCRRLETQKKIILDEEKVKRIYLSEEPLFTGASYSGLERFKGKTTHLDGLHRLFALMDIMDIKNGKRPLLIPAAMATY